MAFNLALYSSNGDADASLLRALQQERLTYRTVSSTQDLSSAYDAVVVDLKPARRNEASLVVEHCNHASLPVVCAVPDTHLSVYNPSWGATDFILLPPRVGEITARLRQATKHGEEEGDATILRVGDLRVDMERYEVFNRDRRVLLTFKEYQLLCLLASNPGRVFTRENLLAQVWEYDYYGGTRTVDVHIRRLRSKVEDPGHTFIETVWNVGYRFRGPAPS